MEEVRDVFFLALDQVERGSRDAAGIAAVVQWLLEASAAPVTGRTDGVARLEVAIVELCAADHLIDDGQAPPLEHVCQRFGVTYLAPLPVDVGFARGAWLGLRWAVGKAPRPLLDTPIRNKDGVLMTTTEIYAELRRRGRDREAARREAEQLVGYSRRLASLVEASAERLTYRSTP